MRILIVAAIAVMVSGCACKCRYNEYMPEDNKLSIPPELRR